MRNFCCFLAAVDSEVILTLGRSRSLLKFLLEAKKKRSFQVVIAEGAPKYVASIDVFSGSLVCKKIQFWIKSRVGLIHV